MLLMHPLWHNAAGNASKLVFRLREAKYLPCDFFNVPKGILLFSDLVNDQEK